MIRKRKPKDMLYRVCQVIYEMPGDSAKFSILDADTREWFEKRKQKKTTVTISVTRTAKPKPKSGSGYHSIPFFPGIAADGVYDIH